MVTLVFVAADNLEPEAGSADPISEEEPDVASEDIAGQYEPLRCMGVGARLKYLGESGMYS